MRFLRPYFNLGLLLVLLLTALVFPALAQADQPQPALALSPDQVWIALLGFLTPLPIYLLNHYAPWTSERVKWCVQMGSAALVGAIYKAIDSGLNFERAATWEYIGTAVVAAFVAHKSYVTGAINTLFKAGSNAPRRRRHSPA